MRTVQVVPIAESQPVQPARVDPSAGTAVSVIVVLGQFGYDAVARLVGLRPKPRFAHGAEVALPDGRTILCSYHPSQQNTFTGTLTEAMFDAVFSRARELSLPTPRRPRR
jgi:uracil-DNA glycosylase